MNFPEANIPVIISALNKYGLTDPIIQAGILSVVGTETGLVPKSEYSYMKTSVNRLRQIFPQKLAKYTDKELESLKTDNIAFFDVIYGYKAPYNGGNTQPGEGYKYRGRGFNGITFKDQYKKYSALLGVDLISNPDLLNQIPYASEALAVYFRDAFQLGTKSGDLKKKLGVNSISEITDLDTASRLALQANAGWKTNLSVPRLVEELKLADEYNDYFYTFTSKVPEKEINPIQSPIMYSTRLIKKKVLAGKLQFSEDCLHYQE